MSRKIDWNIAYKQPMRGKRMGYSSYREFIAKSHEKVAEHQRQAEIFQRMEPVLKKSLLEHMITRTPIRVIQAINYFTEDLIKSESETDIGHFEVVRKAIPSGTELTYSHTDEQLGVWIFKSSRGGEVEVYNTPMIALDRERVVQNPGFWGLLTNTHIFQTVQQAFEASEDAE